jgi:pimeloyl-ACP methyl ester carboxylesterase
LLRKDFLEYVSRMAPEDPDDAALARRYVDVLDPYDAPLVAALAVPDVANGVREALSCPDGYLRDAAVTFRPWPFRLDGIRCPVRLWYGEFDSNVHNGQWLAWQVPGSALTVLDGAGHLGTLLGHWDEILAATLTP